MASSQSSNKLSDEERELFEKILLQFMPDDDEVDESTQCEEGEPSAEELNFDAAVEVYNDSQNSDKAFSIKCLNFMFENIYYMAPEPLAYFLIISHIQDNSHKKNDPYLAQNFTPGFVSFFEEIKAIDIEIGEQTLDISTHSNVALEAVRIEKYHLIKRDIADETDDLEKADLCRRGWHLLENLGESRIPSLQQYIEETKEDLLEIYNKINPQPASGPHIQ